MRRNNTCEAWNKAIGSMEKACETLSEVFRRMYASEEENRKIRTGRKLKSVRRVPDSKMSTYNYKPVVSDRRFAVNVKRKVTWKDIFNNFKSVYPRLSKEAQDYRPYNYMSIVVYLEDGTKVIYDDMAKRAKMLVA